MIVEPVVIGTRVFKGTSTHREANVSLTLDYSKCREVVSGGLLITSAIADVWLNGAISSDYAVVGAPTVDPTGKMVTVVVTDVSAVAGNEYRLVVAATFSNGSTPYVEAIAMPRVSLVSPP